MECLCLDECDIRTSGMQTLGVLQAAEPRWVSHRTNWSGGARREHPELWAGKRSTAVSGYPGSRKGGWGERLRLVLNAWHSLCWDKRVSKGVVTSCLPRPFDSEGREMLAGEKTKEKKEKKREKEKHGDGGWTGEIRGSRMTDIGEAGSIISPDYNKLLWGTPSTHESSCGKLVQTKSPRLFHESVSCRAQVEIQGHFSPLFSYVLWVFGFF